MKAEIIEKELSYKLGGIFFKIRKDLGRFCRERQYGDVLEKELNSAEITFKREFPIEIGERKSNFVDFLIENRVLVDLKAKPYIEKEDFYQMKRYLEVSGLKLGLLVNFQDKFLKPKRVLNSRSHFVDSHQLVDSNRSGFTLVETLVVVAIVVGIAVAGFLGLAGYKNKQALESGLDELRAAVENAKRRSVAQEQGSRWGIRFTNATSGVSSYTVFKGLSYSASGVDRTYSFRTPVGFGNPSASSTYDAVFASLTGALSENKVLTLTSGSRGLIGDLILRTIGSLTARRDKNVVGYWHFDEGAGTAAYDASGGGNTGTLTGGPTWQSGSSCKAGGCVSFDGVDDYVSAGTSLLDAPTTGSVSLWVYPTQNGAANGGNPWNNTTLLAKDNVYLALQQLSSNKIRYYYYSGAYDFYDSTTALSLNMWSLITVTWDASSSSIYLNGTLDASSGSLTWAKVDAGNTGTAFDLGRYGGGYWYRGRMDEVRVWTRALTASEVEAIYNDLK